MIAYIAVGLVVVSTSNYHYKQVIKFAVIKAEYHLEVMVKLLCRVKLNL